MLRTQQQQNAAQGDGSIRSKEKLERDGDKKIARGSETPRNFIKQKWPRWMAHTEAWENLAYMWNCLD